MVNQIYPPELQLNKANTPDTEALFLDLHLSISKHLVFELHPGAYFAFLGEKISMARQQKLMVVVLMFV